MPQTITLTTANSIPAPTSTPTPAELSAPAQGDFARGQRQDIAPGSCQGDFATGMRTTRMLRITGDFATGMRTLPRTRTARRFRNRDAHQLGAGGYRSAREPRQRAADGRLRPRISNVRIVQRRTRRALIPCGSATPGRVCLQAEHDGSGIACVYVAAELDIASAPHLERVLHRAELRARLRGARPPRPDVHGLVRFAPDRGHDITAPGKQDVD